MIGQLSTRFANRLRRGEAKSREGASVAKAERLPYKLMLFGIACQAVTIWITWPVWQARLDPPNLPTFTTPAFSFGWLLLGSLAITVFRPRLGLALHWGTLIVAALFDQFRLQPQFFANALLITACVFDTAHVVARWFLASTWLWAGLHKLFSPDWFGFASHWLVSRVEYVDADKTYLPFAVAVAGVEVGVGLLACVRPKWAAVGCVPMHLGIVLTLSPLALNWNFSVIPWNLAMAAIGGWIMWQAEDRRGSGRFEVTVAALWLIAPSAFYIGWIDHGFAGVLYSDSLPNGLVTHRDSTHVIQGWGRLAVPFPNERRTLRMYFEQVADRGEKLHLSDPRFLLDDQFFVLDEEGKARLIDRDTFFTAQPIVGGKPSVLGVGYDEPRAIFVLQQAGVEMLRQSHHQPIYAVAFTPENFESRLLEYVTALPNVQQVQLAGTSVTDQDMRYLTELRLLTGVGLANTRVTDAGIASLRSLPYLQYVDVEGTKISEQSLREVTKTLPAAD